MTNHNDFDKKYLEYQNLFENQLKTTLDNLSNFAPKTIVDSMIYAVSGGGKRVRPVLMLLTAEVLGVSIEKVMPYAVSLEFIHAYSLVHDDLPCMDNDDYRRGKLSTHKKFGEAIGVLAGDALLNFAVENVLQKPNLEIADFIAMKELFTLSGYSGMIGGQVLDVENENNNVFDLELLNNIYANKTSRLLTAPLTIPSIFADKQYYDEFLNLGRIMGILFQVTDDILDVESSFNQLGKSINKDQTEDKFTSVKLLGLKGAKEYNKNLYNSAEEIINKIPNSTLIKSFLDKMLNRKN